MEICQTDATMSKESTSKRVRPKWREAGGGRGINAAQIGEKLSH